MSRQQALELRLAPLATSARPHPLLSYPHDLSPHRRPDGTWSPGSVDDGTSALALKRGQNWLGSVLVPAGVLGQSEPGASMYATQLAFLKDQTYPAYYYSSPVNNGAFGAAGGQKAWRRLPVQAACTRHMCMLFMGTPHAVRLCEQRMMSGYNPSVLVQAG